MELFLYFIVAGLATVIVNPLLSFCEESTKEESRNTNSSEQQLANRQSNDFTSGYDVIVKERGYEITGYAYTDKIVVKIPEKIQYIPVQAIGKGAFQSCKKLRRIVIPENIEKIDDGAFPTTQSVTVYCTAGSYAQAYADRNNIQYKIVEDLSNININSDQMQSEEPETDRLGNYDVILENDALTIKKFVGVDTEVLEVPAELEGKMVHIIDVHAFCDCKYLEKVIISEGITEIRKEIFFNCPNLREVILPSTLETIGNAAFYNNQNLSYVSLPDSVQYIGKNAFYGTKVREIHIPSQLHSIECETFGNTMLSSVMLPNSIECIEERAFYNCKQLKQVILSDGLVEIGAEAFFGCTALKEIVIPASVQKIGENVFKELCNKVKNNLNITLYCYGASAGLEYARQNNFEYKDAEEFEVLQRIGEAVQNAEFPEREEEMQNELLKNIAYALRIEEVYSCLQQIRDSQISQSVQQKKEQEEKFVRENMSEPICVVMPLENCFTIEEDIANAEYGRIIRHSKYTIIFDCIHDDKKIYLLIGNIIVWENINRTVWNMKYITGCEYFKDGERVEGCGILTGLKSNRDKDLMKMRIPRNGLIVHFTGDIPCETLDFGRSSEKLEKTYETMKYIAGDRSGKNPFRRLNGK